MNRGPVASSRTAVPPRTTRPSRLCVLTPLRHHGFIVHDDIQEVLFPESAIKARVKELARAIALDYQGKAPMVLGVLTGAFCFTADLVRAIEPPPQGLQVDFIRASSYGSSTESSGQVQVNSTTKETFEVAGRHIILVEDILDTGRTLQKLVQHFVDKGAASVKVAALLDKHERRLVELEADYVGFKVENAFVVGYGLDFREEYRTLPYIGVLRPEVYES